ncbi:MAG TPA: PQQ-binding-like beta-propeller repeat protein [Gaiellaceae bacterium]|nr:PQQ-binding-like beta-propeller repeat protein [Gaiellaceae bacterium]
MAAVGCGASHSSWPQPNHDRSNTRAASSTGIDVASAPRLHPVWRFRIRAAPKESGAMTATPVIADGVVYVEDLKSNVYALDLGTGLIKWRRVFDNTSPGPNGLAVAGGRVYGVTDAEAFALSASTGRILWRRLLVSPTEQFVEMAPLSDGGRLYVSTIGLSPGGRGAIYALDAATGRLDWRFDTIKGRWRFPGEAGGGGAWYPPSVVGGVVYWGTTNPYPYGGSRAHPNGAAFAGAALYTDSLLALDAKSGALLWYRQVTPHDVRDYDFQLPPIVTRRLVVGAGKAGRVIAWDRRTHARVWTARVGLHRNDTGPLPAHRVRVCPGLLGGVETPMAFAGGTVFVPVVDLCMVASATGYVPLGTVDPRSGRGELVAIDAATGRRLWRDRLSAPDFGCATVAGGVVFTTTFDGRLLGFDARDGRRLVGLRLSAGTNACPAVAQDRLVVAAGVRLAKGQQLEVEAFAPR